MGIDRIVMENIYTMEQWNHDGTLKIKVGQRVAEDVVFQLRDCVPPAYLSRTMVQVGEAYDNDAEHPSRELFTTFTKEAGVWTYRGHCLYGKTEHRIGYTEKLYGKIY